MGNQASLLRNWGVCFSIRECCLCNLSCSKGSHYSKCVNSSPANRSWNVLEIWQAVWLCSRLKTLTACFSHSCRLTEAVCPLNRHEPGCSLVRRGTHWHTPQRLQGSWRCSRTAVPSGCRRETSQCRARLAAWHTPGSTGSHPATEGLLEGTEGQDWGRGRACRTAGTTPAGENTHTWDRGCYSKDYHCCHLTIYYQNNRLN